MVVYSFVSHERVAHTEHFHFQNVSKYKARTVSRCRRGSMTAARIRKHTLKAGGSTSTAFMAVQVMLKTPFHTSSIEDDVWAEWPGLPRSYWQTCTAAETDQTSWVFPPCTMGPEGLVPDPPKERLHHTCLTTWTDSSTTFSSKIGQRPFDLFP